MDGEIDPSISHDVQNLVWTPELSKKIKQIYSQQMNGEIDPNISHGAQKIGPNKRIFHYTRILYQFFKNIVSYLIIQSRSGKLFILATTAFSHSQFECDTPDCSIKPLTTKMQNGTVLS